MNLDDDKKEIDKMEIESTRQENIAALRRATRARIDEEITWRGSRDRPAGV
jgi:hypothetical protein